MKKRLLALLIAVLCLCLMVCFTACGDDNTDTSTPSSGNPDNNNQTQTVTVGEATNGAIINLLTSKDLTVKVNVATSMAGSMAPTEMDMAIEATAYIVKNDDGVYELKLDMDGTNKMGEDAMELGMEVVILDGKVYMVETTKMGEEENKETEVSDLEFDMNLTALIDSALKAYNDAVGSEIGLELKTKEEVMNLVSGMLNALTNSAVITKSGSNYVVEFDFDGKDKSNAFAEYMKTAGDDTIDEFIVKLLSFEGITLTKEQLSQVITNTFAAGLDFDGLVAKIEAAIKDITGKTVSIKAELDKAQATSTIKTAQIVAAINYIAMSQGEEEAPLPAVEGNETIFDYVKRNFGAELNCDDLAKMLIGEEATLVDIGDAIKATITTYTVEELVAMLAATEVGDDEAAIEEFVNTFFATFGEMKYDAYALSVKLVVDENIKLVSFDFSIDLDMTMGEEDIDVEASFGIDVDYADIAEGTIVAPEITEE